MRKWHEINRMPYFLALMGIGLILLILALWFGQFDQIMALL